MTSLSICSKDVRQLNGLFSLNDLHKASGGYENHRPSKFIRNDQTKQLIAEVEQSPNLGFGNSQASSSASAIKTQHGGINAGTYACKELVYAYAMWISPKFHLHVIRAFDAMQDQKTALPKSHERVIHIYQDGKLVSATALNEYEMIMDTRKVNVLIEAAKSLDMRYEISFHAERNAGGRCQA